MFLAWAEADGLTGERIVARGFRRLARKLPREPLRDRGAGQGGEDLAEILVS